MQGVLTFSLYLLKISALDKRGKEKKYLIPFLLNKNKLPTVPEKITANTLRALKRNQKFINSSKITIFTAVFRDILWY